MSLGVDAGHESHGGVKEVARGNLPVLEIMDEGGVAQVNEVCTRAIESSFLLGELVSDEVEKGAYKILEDEHKVAGGVKPVDGGVDDKMDAGVGDQVMEPEESL